MKKEPLRAVGRNSGKEVATNEIKTTGKPARINTVADVETGLRPVSTSTTDMIRIFVTICDESGTLVYSADNEITCTITGQVRLLGMEDSNPSNIEDYKDNKQHAFHGKLLIYLMPAAKAGKVTVTLSSPGLEGKEIVLDIKE